MSKTLVSNPSVSETPTPPSGGAVSIGASAGAPGRQHRKAMESSRAGMDEAEERLRSDEEEEGEEEGEEAWDDWCSDGDDAAGGLLCLFCRSCFDADSSLFEHCTSEHCFDFHWIVKDLGLDFYGRIRLINFIRSKVRQTFKLD